MATNTASTRMARTRGVRNDVMLGLAGIAAWLLIWLVATSVGPLAENDAFPDPISTLGSAATQLLQQEFWSSVWQTLQIAGLGLGLSIVVGLVVGVALASSAFIRHLLAPTVEFLKPIPGIIILPLLLLIFGPSTTMGLLLVFIGCVWAILIQTYVGVLGVDPVARMATSAMGLNAGLRLRKLVIPSATPSIVTGIRIATASSLILAIGASLIGGAPGLGQLMFVYQNNGDNPSVFGLIILVGLIGLAINVILGVIERRAVPWSIRSEVVG